MMIHIGDKFVAYFALSLISMSQHVSLVIIQTEILMATNFAFEGGTSCGLCEGVWLRPFFA